MRVTVRDVARRARVSPKTVSNVVNGTFPVSPETRLRVEEAVRELDYVPNLSARGLRNGRSGVIALALPDPSTPNSASMISAFVGAAGRRGLTVQIEESAGSVEHEVELLSRARSQLVDGLVLQPALRETATVPLGASLPPVVMIGEVEQPAADHVWVDNVAAVRDLTAFLVQEGHRRIALLGGSDLACYPLRQQGYQEALLSAGLPVDPALEIPLGSWTSAGGAAAVRAHLARHPLPDALVCCSDTLAVGVLGALWMDGYRVPDDISVVGYDDITEAAFTVPPLTTVHVDCQALAEAALELLLRRIDEPSRPTTSRTIPYRVVRRASTRPC